MGCRACGHKYVTKAGSPSSAPTQARRRLQRGIFSMQPKQPDVQLEPKEANIVFNPAAGQKIIPATGQAESMVTRYVDESGMIPAKDVERGTTPVVVVDDAAEVK